jgi:hypothetical protein
MTYMLDGQPIHRRRDRGSDPPAELIALRLALTPPARSRSVRYFYRLKESK